MDAFDDAIDQDLIEPVTKIEVYKQASQGPALLEVHYVLDDVVAQLYHLGKELVADFVDEDVQLADGLSYHFVEPSSKRVHGKVGVVLGVFLLEVVADEGKLMAFLVEMKQKLFVLLRPDLVQS